MLIAGALTLHAEESGLFAAGSVLSQPVNSAASDGVTLISPENGAETIVFHPSLSWKAPFNRSLSMAIQIAGDERMSDILVSDKVHSVSDWYVPARRLDPGTYWWRVRGERDGGDPGAWSAVRSFKVIESEVTLRIAPGMSADEIREIGNQAAAASSARIVFEPATYRFNPGFERAVFEWRGADNIILDGGGSTFVIGEPSAQLWKADDCRNILVGNFSVEYDPRPHTIARVVATDAATGALDAKIIGGFSGIRFPRTVNQMFCYVQDPADPRRLHPARPAHIYLDPEKTADLGDGTLRYFVRERVEFAFLKELKAGDQMVVCYRRWPLSYVQRCADFTLYDIRMTKSESFFFMGGGNRDMKFLRLKTDSEEGLYPSPAGWVTGNDRHGPWIEGCFFEAIADDGPNITGNAYLIDRVEDGVLTLRTGVTWQNAVWQTGDRLLFWNPVDGQPVLATTIAEVLGGDREIRNGIQRVRVVDPVAGIAPGGEVATNTHVYNLSCQNDGFVARNNRLICGRRFGFNVKANNALIENNQFEGLSSSAIYLENAPTFWEGLTCERVVIQNNTVSDCGASVDSAMRQRASGIFVNLWKFPSQGSYTTAWQGHRDILIRNNTVIDWESAAIAVDNASHVTIQNNTIQSRNKTGFLIPKNTAILIGTDTSEVTVGDNTISDKRDFIKREDSPLK